MITANVIQRVFLIRSEKLGTAFAIDVDGKQYLITAKHVAGTIEGDAQVNIFAFGDWKNVPVALVGHAEDADVTVLAAREILTPAGLPLPASSDGMIYGQDVYFLGFPYGMVGRFRIGEGGYPIPFVKKAILSGIEPPKFLLDGHNNPGFSGGPVVFRKPKEWDMRVGTVVSGFAAVKEPIRVEGIDTRLSFDYNTGIIVTSNIGAATKLIEANPIGCPLE